MTLKTISMTFFRVLFLFLVMDALERPTASFIRVRVLLFLTPHFFIPFTTMITKLAVTVVAFLSLSANAFVATHSCPRSTRLYLEDHIASMIDQELERLAKKKETETAWREKNQPFLKQDLPEGFDFEESTVMEHVLAPRQRRKDKRLAKDDPQAYCADRCIATGNCEVFEDIFDFTPSQVREFCEECVLSEEEEPCNVPDVFFSGDYESLIKP